MSRHFGSNRIVVVIVVVIVVIVVVIVVVIGVVIVVSPLSARCPCCPESDAEDSPPYRKSRFRSQFVAALTDSDCAARV